MFSKNDDFKSVLKDLRSKRQKDRKQDIKRHISFAATEGRSYAYFYDEFPHDLIKMVAEEEGLEVIQTDHKGVIKVTGW